VTYSNLPSAIIEPGPTPKWTDDDDDVVGRMVAAVIDAGNDPQAFDLMVNDNPDFQRVLLRWRGHLTLAARAFYRMQKNAWDSALK
jgi:hypothetical protein